MTVFEDILLLIPFKALTASKNIPTIWCCFLTPFRHETQICRRALIRMCMGWAWLHSVRKLKSSEGVEEETVPRGPCQMKAHKPTHDIHITSFADLGCFGYGLLSLLPVKFHLQWIFPAKLVAPPSWAKTPTPTATAPRGVCVWPGQRPNMRINEDEKQLNKLGIRNA